MIAGCGSQLRLASIPGPEGPVIRPVGLDFAAVMLVGAGAGADLALLADILPRLEAAIVTAGHPEEGGSDGD